MRARAAPKSEAALSTGKLESAAINDAGIITVEPGKRGGKPCVRSMRITVSDVLDDLAGGTSEDDILRDFPYLTRDDILAFAAEREQRLRGRPVTW